MASINVLTVNAHMGFNLLNRRFVLPELREAIREVSADMVFLQEVLGEHAHHARRQADWPQGTQYEFLADTLWTQFAYGRNAVYPHGHHGNALLSKFPILHRTRTATFPSTATNSAACCIAIVRLPEQARSDGPHHLRAPGPGANRTGSGRSRCCAASSRDEIPADAPLIVAGDFNDWRVRGHPLMLAAGAALRRGVRTPARTGRPRKPSRRAGRRCRWIASTCATLRVARRGACCPRSPWSHLSDHVPLLARVEL